MAEPADGGAAGSLRDLAERMLPRGRGVSRDRLEAVAEDLVGRGVLSREAAAELLTAIAGVTGGTGQGIGDRAAGALSSLVDQLGLVRERQLEELELRVAQLEHRLGLLERDADRRTGDRRPSTP